MYCFLVWEVTVREGGKKSLLGGFGSLPQRVVSSHFPNVFTEKNERREKEIREKKLFF